MNSKVKKIFYNKYPKLNFIDKPSHLICGICNDIFKHPHQTKCGCRFCFECVKPIINSGSMKCPGNSEECEVICMNNICFDAAVNKEIMKLQLHCPHELCKEVKSLNEIIDHVDECDYRVYSSTKCGEKHENNEFVNLHPIVHSKQILIKKNEKKRNSLMKFFLQLLPCFKCSHECDIGGYKITLNYNEDLLENIKELEREMKELKLEIEDLRIQNSLLKEDVTKLDILKRSGDISSFIEAPLHKNGKFIWQISDLSIKRRNAESGGPVSVTSDPFYTSEFGYKICLKIYPAGDGIGRGSHLSVYFVIMKGDYDKILSWPFKFKVTLELLDQEGNEKHFTEVFRPDKRSICYEKPKEAMNVASGAPKFYEWNKLISSRYYKNDTIYVKMSII